MITDVKQNCKSCGAEMPSYALECKNCGAKIKLKRHWLTTLLLGFNLVWSIGALAFILLLYSYAIISFTGGMDFITILTIVITVALWGVAIYAHFLLFAWKKKGFKILIGTWVAALILNTLIGIINGHSLTDVMVDGFINIFSGILSFKVFKAIMSIERDNWSYWDAMDVRTK